jgi:hypothetical protein
MSWQGGADESEVGKQQRGCEQQRRPSNPGQLGRLRKGLRADVWTDEPGDTAPVWGRLDVIVFGLGVAQDSPVRLRLRAGPEIRVVDCYGVTAALLIPTGRSTGACNGTTSVFRVACTISLTDAITCLTCSSDMPGYRGSEISLG